MMDYSGISDEELIRRAGAGESEIENYLLDKYKTMVRKNARVLYLEGGDKEDLLQEGMLGLFKAIRSYEPGKGASFATYANQCITNQMFSAISAAKRKKHAILSESVSLSEIGEAAQEAAFAYAEDPEEIVIEREAEAQLKEQIRKTLSPMENRVLDHYLQGMNYREIAAKLGKPEKSIDNALQRIRTKVRAVRSGNEQKL